MESADLNKSIEAPQKKPSRKRAGFLAAAWLVAMTGSSPLEEREPSFFDMHLGSESCSADGHLVVFESDTHVEVPKGYRRKLRENIDNISQTIMDDYKIVVSSALEKVFNARSNSDIFRFAENEAKMQQLDALNQLSILIIVNKAFGDFGVSVDTIDVSSPVIRFKNFLEKDETGVCNGPETQPAPNPEPEPELEPESVPAPAPNFTA